MTKRKAFFKVLKERWCNFVGTNAFYTSTCLFAFIIFAVVTFIFVKQKPIDLTEDEIEYYTSQAEILRYKGQFYLDENIKADLKNDGSINIYNYNHPYSKAKLNVSFSNDGTPTPIPYYEHSFILEAIALTFVLAILETIIFVLIWCLIEWLIKKIRDFKDDVTIELENYNSENDED